MNSLFDKELTQMEKEVRDLKTIHQRGLGAVRFYRKIYTKQNASAGTHNFRVNIYEDEPTPAIFTAHINVPTPTILPSVRVYARSYGAQVQVYCYTAGDIRLDVISSAEIEEITEA